LIGGPEENDFAGP